MILIEVYLFFIGEFLSLEVLFFERWGFNRHVDNAGVEVLGVQLAVQNWGVRRRQLLLVQLVPVKPLEECVLFQLL